MNKNFGIIAIVLFFAVVTVAAAASNPAPTQITDKSVDKAAVTNTFPTGTATPVPAHTQTPRPSPSTSTTPTVSSTPTPKPQLNIRNYYIDFTQLKDRELILVNSYIPVPESYSVKPRLYSEEAVDELIFLPLTQMLEDAKSDGLSLWIASGYRSPQEQAELLENGIQNRIDDFGLTRAEAEENALKSFAKPGYSEHNTGLAVDFNTVSKDFEQTDEYKWLTENAWKYGFIQRYPEDKTDITGIIYEPWHYRYVGTENARKINEGNLCLEEYIIDLKNS